MKNDIILTGPPRSGTTLACYLLNQAPDTVALHEPMNLNMFINQSEAISSIQQFFAQMRTSLLQNRTAISKISEGKIPSNPFNDNQSTSRKSIVKKGLVHFDKDLSQNFKLILKHNGHFTFLLPQLQDLYPVYILIRNPVATIASWNTVNAPVAQGNLHVLKFLNPELYYSLEKVEDLITRQVILLDSMYKCYLASTKSIIIRYEDIISTSGNNLNIISEGTVTIKDQLKNKNTNPLYDATLIDEIRTKLLSHNGSYIEYYNQEQIENLQF